MVSYANASSACSGSFWTNSDYLFPTIGTSPMIISVGSVFSTSQRVRDCLPQWPAALRTIGWLPATTSGYFEIIRMSWNGASTMSQRIVSTRRPASFAIKTASRSRKDFLDAGNPVKKTNWQFRTAWFRTCQVLVSEKLPLEMAFFLDAAKTLSDFTLRDGSVAAPRRSPLRNSKTF